eukprot:GFUD01007771.1.p1 GENE.GFUD01007771.1~~GFUD01007771.1.p1  ORF type:complete len:337 (+),score=77.82 GFUD01007771.1:41-1012(+)
MKVHMVLNILILTGLGGGDAVGFPIPELVTGILKLAWDEVNPNSLDNRVKEISNQLKDIKTHLEKLEHTVIFGRDIKTIEYLIGKYNTRNLDKQEWADIALEYGSDGFDRSLISVKEMMKGTSNLFAEGSIFAVIAKGEESNVCANIEDAWEYLISLWTVGHILWTKAYKIKHQDFKTFARQKKKEATSEFENFQTVKDEATPDYCDCFKKGMFYADLDYMISKKFPSNVNTSKGCQRQCNSDDDCHFWTFIKPIRKCFTHESEGTMVEVKEEDAISGPKVCPVHFSFCCNLGFAVSVFIVTLIVIICIALLCCCCIFCCNDD